MFPGSAFSRHSSRGAGARRWLGAALVLGLFFQWAWGLGESIESGEEEGCCPPAGCRLQAAAPAPFCGVTRPDEEPVTVASIFYQAAVLPESALPPPGRRVEPLIPDALTLRSAPPSVPRRPPRA
jgi:hypothetical protein